MWQVIFSNPCERVKPPKIEKYEPIYLDEFEAQKLIGCLEAQPNRQYEVMAKLLLYTGFRRGELCGLEWDDVNFDKCLVTVARSSMYLPQKGVFTDKTKNSTSHRTIKLPTVALDLLKAHQKRQYEQKQECGTLWQDSNRLFTSWNGSPIHPNVFSKWFADFVAENDLPKINVHSLRHTNATLQIAGGVAISAVSKRLGHSSVNTTGNIYIHAIKSADEAAAETLQDFLSPTTRNADHNV